MSDNDSIYHDLANSILSDDGEVRYANIGYKMTKDYLVVSKEDSSKVFVRYRDGSFGEVLHKNTVNTANENTIRDLPVVIKKDWRGRDYIHDIDWDNVKNTTSMTMTLVAGNAAAPSTPLNNLDITVFVVNGLQIFVSEGFYFHNDIEFWKGAAYTDLNLAIPPTANHHWWAIICIDPTTDPHSLTVVTSPASQHINVPLDKSKIDDAPFVENGLIGLAAIELANGASYITNNHIYHIGTRYRKSDSAISIFTLQAAGLVPNPGTASGRYLKDDGTWGTITLPASWTRIDKGLHYSSGNIGVGTDSPDGLLHVFSGSGGKITPDINADDLIVENSTNAGISILAPDASNTNLEFGSPSDATGALIQWNYDVGQFRIGPHTPGAKMILTSGNNVEAMSIDKDGNIRVGKTLVSNYKFDVAGSCRLNGWVNVGGPLILEPENATGEGAHISLKASKPGLGWDFDVYQSNLRFYNVSPGKKLVSFFTNLSDPNAETRLYVQGNTGIGTSAPTQKLDVRGNVRADDYIEYSNMFTGDALTAIKAIRPEATDAPTDLSTTSDWAEVDHTTLPDRVKIAIQEEYYVNKHTGEQLAANKSPDQTDAPDDWELRTEETLGRSVGAGVQLNLRAIQQLIEQNEQLQAHNEQITKRLEQLEALWKN